LLLFAFFDIIVFRHLRFDKNICSSNLFVSPELIYISWGCYHWGYYEWTCPRIVLGRMEEC